MGAIYIVDACIIIQQKSNFDSQHLLCYKAKLYEKMALEDSEPFICLKDTETALRIYKSLNIKEKIVELEARYTAIRQLIRMNNVEVFEFSEDYINYCTKKIRYLVESSNNTSIITNIALFKHFNCIDKIQAKADYAREKGIIESLFTTNILDEFGNTIAEYSSEKEIKEMFFWKSFDMYFQTGISLLNEYIIESYKAKKFTYQNVIFYMEGTWYNEPIIHTYNGEKKELYILDVIKPGLKKFFEELDYYFLDPKNNNFDYIIVIDTLTLKMETILRFICEKLNIATFKTRDKGSAKLVMEKLLDDLLSDLKDTPENPTGFKEEDRLMLKYVLTLKGRNLRNRVAHGLMDLGDYSFTDILILLYLIIKLSTYKFQNVDDGVIII